MRGRPLAPLTLDDADQETLERWVKRPKTAQALAMRARIVLRAAEGAANTQIADEVGITKQTVGKWRKRFVGGGVDGGVDGLLDEPRPGAPRTIGDEDVERVIRITLEETPKDATHWSTRSMAQRTGMSQSAISRIWRAFALQPHRSETFKLSSDPLFIEKVRDIVGLYLHPPDRALVLCVDEKAQIQALDRSQPLLPMRPGQIERRTHDYVRNGTTSLFAALDTKTGEVIAECHKRHRSIEFRRFLDTIEATVPQGLDIHPRFHPLHFTPTSSSWLNLVERWFGALTEKQLRRGVFRSTRELEDTILRYVDITNHKPFVWTKSADQILQTLARFCTRTSDSGH